MSFLTDKRFLRTVESGLGSAPKVSLACGDMSRPNVGHRYLLDESHLGIGGFCEVFRAYDTALDHFVAIKFLAERWANDESIRDRFLNEARMLRKAQHSGLVVSVYDINENSPQPYFVMEWADCGTIADELRAAAEGLSVLRALTLAAASARAVQVLHDTRILHRDIKPANFLITTQDVRSSQGGGERIMVADLGLAKNLERASGLTAAVGTSGYMAPEQRAGGTDANGLDERADVFALGVMTYELLTGQIPVVERKQPAGEIRDLRRDLPDPAAAAVMRALRFRREDRQASAGELARILAGEATRLGVGLSDPERTHHRRATTGGRRGRRLGVSVGALLATVVVAAGVAAVMIRPDESSGRQGALPPLPSAVRGPVSATSTIAPADVGSSPTPASHSSAPPRALSPTAAPSTSPARVSTEPPLPAQLKVVADEQLHIGQSWRTSKVSMTMIVTGSLVLTDRSGRQLWSSGSKGTNYRAIMQQDGNLVIYDQRPFGIWSSKTAGHEGAYLLLTADGNAEVIDQGDVLWSAL